MFKACQRFGESFGASSGTPYRFRSRPAGASLMYTVKHASRLVGVSEATLRAWDRRHGIGPTTRTEAGYRLYDDEAVGTLRTMKALVDSGWSLGLAAAEACRRSTQASSPDELVDFAESYDAPGLAALLDERFGHPSFEHMVDDWLLPALNRVGQAWVSGRVSAAGEHFVSHAVARRLAASFDAAGESPNGPQVVVGLPPGCRHDLGLLCFATAARRAGIGTRYLGADVPLADWQEAVDSNGVVGAVLAVPRNEDVQPARRTVAALLEIRPDLLVLAGGAHQEAMAETVVGLGHHIGSAVRRLTQELGPR